MATAPSTDDLIDDFLAQRGHDVEAVEWEDSYNKKQCPECGGLHDGSPAECSVCGWTPRQ
jgi:rubrerythrin